MVLGGRALLPADYLSGMQPWQSVSPAKDVPEWNPLMWDGIAQFYPWKVHYDRTMAAGEIPLWNPHQFCGAPFAANAQTAIFYPPNLLFVIFSPVRAFGLSAALHLFLAGVFTFLLARALGMGRFGATVSGIVFEFSAFMVVWMELPTFINVATWLPLALYLILISMDRSGPIHSIFAGLALGVAILAGHFQVASYVIEAAALWWLWLIIGRVKTHGREEIKRGILLALLCFGVAFLIAAPQVLPTVELAGMSHRVRQVTAEGYNWYISNAAPARNLITLFMPGFYGNPSTADNPYWIGSAADYMEYALYIGLLPLLLAIFGGIFAFRWRGAAFFVILTALSLLFAFGTPINYIAYYFLPGTSALGGPNRTLLLFCFSAAMLAGYGAHWFIQMAQENYRATNRKLGWRALSVGGAAFIILFITFQFIATASISELGVDVSTVLQVAKSQYLSFGSLIIAGLAILALYTAGQISKSLFACLALAVIVADLFSFGMKFNPTAPVEKVYPETKLTKWLKDNAGGARLMPINSKWSLDKTPDAILPPNAATVYGFNDMQGYDSLFSKRYKDFVDENLGIDSSPRENGNILFIKSYTCWPLGMAGYVLSKDVINAERLTLVFQADGVNVYKIEPYQEVYATDNPLFRESTFPSIGTAMPKCKIVDRNTNQVIVNVETGRMTQLILAQMYYPGWHAYVDGVEQPISVAWGIFPSVRVQEGSSTVIFKFQPGTYVVGTFLGLLGVAVVGIASGMVFVRWRR